MGIDLNDVVSATKTQRNGAADDAAKYYALWQAAVREVDALKIQLTQMNELKAKRKK